MSNWEEKWNLFKERKLSPEDKKGYFGTSPGKHNSFGYNSPGVIPELIWKDLPKFVYRNEILKREELGRRKYIGDIDSERPSLRGYGFDKGFWFTVGPKDSIGVDFYLENPDRYEEQGKTAVQFVIPKAVLNPKKVYVDIEGAPSGGPGDKYYEEEIDSEDFAWFFYADFVSMAKVKVRFWKDLKNL